MTFISLSVFLLSLFACGTKNITGMQQQAAKAEPKPEVNSSTNTTTISGSIMQTFSYCGGAAPPQFLLEQLAEPKPYSGKKLHVIKGDSNTEGRKIILSFTSDTAGKFSFQLEPGTYSIILDEQFSAPDAKKYKTQLQNIDEDCYKKWWVKPYYLLEVPATSKPTTIKGLNFNFHHRCFISSDVPCLRYEGPMPP